MRERFLPILDKLPDSCDWELHVLTVTQPVIEGDPNRKSHSTKSKKLVAAALCREAEKQKATGEPAVHVFSIGMNISTSKWIMLITIQADEQATLQEIDKQLLLLHTGPSCICGDHRTLQAWSAHGPGRKVCLASN